MLQDRLILSHLRRTHNVLHESYEVIQPETLYKINDDIRLEFTPIIQDVWSFCLITIDGKKDIGKVYRVSDAEYVARASNVPDIEKTNKTLIDCAVDLCFMLGEF